MSLSLIEQTKAIRRVNTPLVLIQTADQPACQAAIATALNGSAVTFGWDAVRGLRPANDGAVTWLKEFLGVSEGRPADVQAAFAQLAANTGNVNACLDWAQNLPDRAVLFQTNAGDFWSNPVTATGVLNLRETFKKNKRTLIGTSAGFELPESLRSSVVVIDEPLPGDDELSAILDNLFDGVPADVPRLDAEGRREALTAVRGLSAFMSEQTFAMSLTKSGLDLAQVWARKRTAFNQIPGVTLEAEGPTFKDIEGLSQILARERAHFGGTGAAAVVVRIDEIDKALAGAALGDTSGTSQAALGYILSTMEDEGWTGFIAVGPGGAGKSLVSKALGREFGRPVVTLDVEGTKGSLVGESGEKIRGALKAIKGLSGGRPVLVVATCNKLDVLPPELRRRFKQGIWFFDLPTADERAAIWKLYTTKHGLKVKAADIPPCSNWTGAEIRNCVEMAADEGISLKEAAAFIVPVAEADPEGLRKLRVLASDRFLNASAPGKYERPDATATTEPDSKGRKIDLGE